LGKIAADVLHGLKGRNNSAAGTYQHIYIKYQIYFLQEQKVTLLFT
jgi:hypothetical protein